MKRIFLSYSRKAKEIVKAIADALSEAGYEVLWKTVNDPRTEAGAAETIQQIAEADWVIAVVSPAFAQSEFAVGKIVYAQHRRKPILSVVVDHAQLPINLLSYDSIELGEDLQAGMYRLLSYLRDKETARLKETLETPQLSPEETTNASEAILSDSSLSRIFIAYSRKQRSLAQSISEVLIRNGKAIFWDAKIKAGATWRQTIQKALDDATHLVVIWTPEAAESDEVEREVSYALAERKVIVPILSKEIPKLPYHLHGLHYIVLEEDVSKIEADLLKAIAQFSDGEDIWQ
jgi:hypothetical protein